MTLAQMQAEMKDELSTLTEAQSKLDEAMETIAPLQQQVSASRNKLKILSVGILRELGVIVRRGRGWALETAELPKEEPGAAPQTESQGSGDGNIPDWVEPRTPATKKVVTKKRGAKKPTRNFSPETRIQMARRMAEMQAKRAGKGKAAIRKAGNEAAERRRTELRA